MEFIEKVKKSCSKPFADKHFLRKLAKGTEIDGKEELIFSVFSNLKKQIALNDICAALIVYSACTWEEKCALALKLIDQDGNEVISKDEMLAMCSVFIRSIGAVTRTPLWKNVNFKKLAQECFRAADSHPDGSITLFE